MQKRGALPGALLPGALLPGALLPGDLAVWDGHVAMVVGKGW